MTTLERKTIIQSVNEIFSLELDGYRKFESTSYYGLRKTKLEHTRNGNIAEVVSIPENGIIRIFINNKIVKESCLTA